MIPPEVAHSTLDADTCRVTHHAVERYMRRRGGRCGPAAAEAALRRLLRRASDGPRAPIIVTHEGRTGRRYVVGELALVLSADHTTLITFYQWERKSPSKQRKRRKRP